MDRPHRFTDEMVRGAFHSLRHIHLFEESAGTTAMIDILEWTAPLGFLGRLADRLFLVRHMKYFVATKQAALKRMIESKSM
jgi:ligand-binding SRPBCC domain-containing protein